MRSVSLRQYIYDFEQISLHKLFPVCAIIYTAVLGGGIMNEESKTSVLNPVSISYLNTSIVRIIKHE